MRKRFKRKLLSLLILSSLLITANIEAAPMPNAYKEGISNVLMKYGVVHNANLRHNILTNPVKVNVMNGIEKMFNKLGMYGLNDYFNPNDVRQLSGLKAEEYAKIITGTGLEGYGYAFENVEKTHNVNGLFVLGICILESGWGSSKLAQDKQNYTGMQAYDSNAYSNARTFKDLEECVNYTADRLNKNYLTEGGKFYSGGTSIFDVNVYYCTQSDWALKIVSTLHDEIKEHLYK